MEREANPRFIRRYNNPPCNRFRSEKFVERCRGNSMGEISRISDTILPVKCCTLPIGVSGAEEARCASKGLNFASISTLESRKHGWIPRKFSTYGGARCELLSLRSLDSPPIFTILSKQ